RGAREALVFRHGSIAVVREGVMNSWKRACFLLAAMACARPVAAQTSPSTQGLARPEVDKPISPQMDGAQFIRALDVLSSSIGVPFVIQFDEQTDLRVTIVAKSMKARTILEGLATSYDLSFADSEGGVVVTRRGVPRPAMPIVVGEWPPVPDIPYEIRF